MARRARPAAGSICRRPARSTSWGRWTSCSYAAASTCARPSRPRLLTALRRLAERRVRAGRRCAPAATRSARAGLLDQLSRHHSLGESLGAARGISARAHQRSALHHRPRPLHLLRRHGAARSDAESHRAKLGPRISQLVSEQFIVDRVRKDTDRQYIPLRAQIGVSHAGLIRVAQLMEENIEKPLSLEKIAQAPRVCRAGRSSGFSSAI